MRILMVADPMIPVPPTHYGGIERIIDMLCRTYSTLGHDVVLMAHPDSNTSAELVSLPGLKVSSKFDAAKNAATLARQTIRFQPNIVHSFGRLIQMLPLMPLRVPKIMSYQREPSLSGIQRANKLARKGTMLFTGCSDYISNQIATVANCVTVYNGVGIDRYSFRRDVAPDAPLVFLGRVERIKGVHNAIRIANATGRRLRIAGNIPQTAEHLKYFESEVKPHLSKQIEYIGTVDDSQKNELLGNALALMMAIEWNEPFGIVMAEAFACGTPVIGTPRGAVPEVVLDQRTGFVRDLPELDSVIKKLPEINRQDCRIRCEQMFSDTVIASNYLQLYEKLG